MGIVTTPIGLSLEFQRHYRKPQPEEKFKVRKYLAYKIDFGDTYVSIRFVMQKEKGSNAEFSFKQESCEVEVQVPRTWKVLPFERYRPTDFEQESKRKFRVLRVGGDKYLPEEKKGVKVFWKEKSKTFAFEMSTDALIGLQRSLQQLVQVQQNQQRSKHIKTPEIFKPSTRDEELRQWPDWRFSFMQFMKSVDPKTAELPQTINKKPKEAYDMDTMDNDTKALSNKFYSILISYMKNRPLSLIRHLEDFNGFKRWSPLVRDMEPSTRQRGLALLTQLSKVEFSSSKTISDQIPACESFVRKYERVSGSKFSEDSMIASILLALPMALRTQLQMQITETTTYEQLKSNILHYESITTRWDATNVLQMPTRQPDEAVLMEVDMVTKGKKGQKGTDKGKGKSKSTGKDDGKGKS